MEFVEVANTSQGVAFEVQMKSAAVADMITPVRKRLEERAAEQPLPRLLFSAREREAQIESPVKVAAARARAANEKKREVVDRVRSEKDQEIIGKKTSLEETLRRAEEKRRTSLAEKSTKAGKHFEVVKSKVDGCQQTLANSVQEQQQKLLEALEQKAAVHDAGVSRRGGRAGAHNGQVAERKQLHSRMLTQRADELRGRLEVKAARQPVRKPAFYVEPKFIKGKTSEGQPCEQQSSEVPTTGTPCKGQLSGDGGSTEASPATAH